MNQLRKLIYACLLTICCTFVSVAGEIQNPGAAAPVPIECSVAGEIQNPGLTMMALDLVERVLALLL